MFEELLRREEAAGIEPDPEVTAFIHGSNLIGKRHNVVTEYTLRLLGLEVGSQQKDAFSQFSWFHSCDLLVLPTLKHILQPILHCISIPDKSARHVRASLWEL